MPTSLPGARAQPAVLPEVCSEVLVLRRATQPVVPQPQVLQLWRRLSAQVLQINRSIAAELQDLSGTEGTNTLRNEPLLALLRAARHVLCSQTGPPSPSCCCRVSCLRTFSVRGRWAEVILLIWLALRMSSSNCWNCSRPSSTSSTCRDRFGQRAPEPPYGQGVMDKQCRSTSHTCHTD